MAQFHLQIISPRRVEYDGQVESLIAPGEGGYLGVLADHAPLLTTLTDGTVTIRGAEGTRELKLSGGGFLEIHKNKVLMLARNIE
jgi:F-type H+-transporting ATPase subunit epsilon